MLRRAVAWFAERGVTVERVLSDNGSAYRSHLWRDTCAELGITPKRTRPYRPQTNGKIERFHRTLADGWAFKKFYNSETPAAPLCQHGSTSTTTTGPTPPSGSAHPSPGWTTWLDITPRPVDPLAVSRSRIAWSGAPGPARGREQRHVHRGSSTGGSQRPRSVVEDCMGLDRRHDCVLRGSDRADRHAHTGGDRASCWSRVGASCYGSSRAGITSARPQDLALTSPGQARRRMPSRNSLRSARRLHSVAGPNSACSSRNARTAVIGLFPRSHGRPS